MFAWFQVLGGGLLLYFGAEWFVGGASALALAVRVPQLLVGLTVVAYGTSAPEVIVGWEASRAGHGEVALANVVGSNIANVGLILGMSALVRPARVDGALRRRELPILIASTLLLIGMLRDGGVSRAEAGTLLACAFLYTLWMVTAARNATVIRTAVEDAAATMTAAGVAAGAPRTAGVGRSTAIAAAGLLSLVYGGSTFVDGAVSLARALGMSERMVGLTIVALGTSLPELVTGVVAAARGHSDIAVGNVVGSNIFNALLCVGVAGLAGPIETSLTTLAPDLFALMLMTGVAALFLRTERSVTRWEGASCLVLYVVFITFTVIRA